MSVLDWFRRMPTKKFINDIPNNPRNTPDLWRLEQQKAFLVFEYGRGKVGGPEHFLFTEGSPFPAFTVERFTLWINRPLREPVALRLGVPRLNPPRSKIHGELYVLSKESIMKLDNHRQNGVKYHRKSIKVILPCLEPCPPQFISRQTVFSYEPIMLEAYMYLGAKAFWESEILWDAEFYRGRNASECNYQLAPVFHDHARPFIKQYFCFNGYHNDNNK